MDFFGVLHKPRNQTNNKGNTKLTMSKIDKTVNHLSLKCSIDYVCLTSFGELYSRLKSSSMGLKIDHLKNVKISITYLY
jgi:hypothetical protein